MSVSKVLGGTIIATPAIGGGGYVIYKEVTKEGETSLSTEQARDSQDVPSGTLSETAQTRSQEARDGERAQPEITPQEPNNARHSTGSVEITQQSEAGSSTHEAEAPEGNSALDQETGQSPTTGGETATLTEADDAKETTERNPADGNESSLTETQGQTKEVLKPEGPKNPELKENSENEDTKPVNSVLQPVNGEASVKTTEEDNAKGKSTTDPNNPTTDDETAGKAQGDDVGNLTNSREEGETRLPKDNNAQ